MGFILRSNVLWLPFWSLCYVVSLVGTEAGHKGCNLDPLCSQSCYCSHVGALPPSLLLSSASPGGMGVCAGQCEVQTVTPYCWVRAQTPMRVSIWSFPNAPKIKHTTRSHTEEGTPAGEKPSLLFSTGTHVFMFMLRLINYVVTGRKMQVEASGEDPTQLHEEITLDKVGKRKCLLLGFSSGCRNPTRKGENVDRGPQDSLWLFPH